MSHTRIASLVSPVVSHVKKRFTTGGNEEKKKKEEIPSKKFRTVEAFISQSIIDPNCWSQGERLESETILVVILGETLGNGVTSLVRACMLREMVFSDALRMFPDMQKVHIRELCLYFMIVERNLFGYPERLCVKTINCEWGVNALANEVRALEKYRKNPSQYPADSLAKVPQIYAIIPLGIVNCPIMLVMDRMLGQDLVSHIESSAKSKNNFIPRHLPVASRIPGETDAIWIIEKIARTLDHLHSLGVFHMDLKPENVLVDFDSMSVAIVDFGLSITIESVNEGSQQIFKKPMGTDQYMCPEMKSGYHYDPKKVDIWNVGTLLFTITSGVFPPKDPERIEEACNNARLSQSLTRLLCDLLQRDPVQRADLRRLLYSTWVRRNRM